MIYDEDLGGGGFADVRDGQVVEPVIRPPDDELGAPPPGSEAGGLS